MSPALGAYKGITALHEPNIYNTVMVRIRENICNKAFQNVSR
jgi:hypothetical protein